MRLTGRQISCVSCLKVTQPRSHTTEIQLCKAAVFRSHEVTDLPQLKSHSPAHLLSSAPTVLCLSLGRSGAPTVLCLILGGSGAPTVLCLNLGRSRAPIVLCLNLGRSGAPTVLCLSLGRDAPTVLCLSLGSTGVHTVLCLSLGRSGAPTMLCVSLRRSGAPTVPEPGKEWCSHSALELLGFSPSHFPSCV